MRKSEFRGKRIDTGEWVYGHGYMIDNATVGHPVYVYSDARFKHYKVDPDTVGQYTGFVDRNGVKIFKGDIFEFEHIITRKLCRSVVVWNNDEGMFGIKTGKKRMHFSGIPYMLRYGVKIVGKIHDNPELLKVNSEI